MGISSVVVGLVTVTWVTWLMYERRCGPKYAEGTRWLHYGLSVKAIGIALLIAGIAIPIHEVHRGRNDIAIVMGCITLGSGIPASLLGFFWGVGYDNSGVYTRSPWRKSRFIPWNQLETIQFSQGMKQWVVRARAQGTVRINELVPGVEHFVAEVRRRGVSA